MEHEPECPNDPCCCLIIDKVRKQVIQQYNDTWHINLTRIGEGNYAKGYLDALDGLMPKYDLSKRRWVL